MVFPLVAMMLESGVAEVFNSPFVVPVAGCVMVACIVVSSIWAKVRSAEIRSHERLARIAHGLPVEPDWEEATARAAVAGMANPAPAAAIPARAGRPGRPNDGGAARRAGMVLVSVGVGLLAFFAALATIVQVREVMAGGVAGLIPLAIGVGFLIDARLKRGEYERYLEWERFGGGADAVAGAAAPSTPPPPPPMGMTEAQASDWRPLH